MDVRNYVDTVLASRSEDWLRVDAPIFLQDVRQQIYAVAGQPAQSAITVSGHDELLTLKSNLSIAMAVGMSHMEDYAGDWALQFPDRAASSEYVDLLWNGMVIHREIVVNVDGGRCVLPLPAPRTSKVPRRRYEFVRLVHALTGPTADYDDYAARAGLTAVDDLPWLANPLK